MKPNILRLFAICALTLLPAAARAASATWSGQLNSNWNVSQNWSPQTVPNGPNDVATLGGSNNRDVYLSANTEVYGITFPKPLFPTAVNYLVTVSQSLTLTISGTGITNNSGQAQNFLTAVDGSGQEGAISFTNSATAGICTITNNASTVYGAKGGFTEFLPNSTAGSASIVNAGSAANNGGSGTTYFYGGSTAGTGKFVNNPCGVAQSTGQINSGGSTNFYDRSSADNATFTNVGGALSGTGGGVVQFGGFATAGNAIAVSNGGTASGAIGGSIGFFNYATAANGNFISNGGTVSGANGGSIYFFESATAANATFTNNGGTATNASGAVLRMLDTSSAAAATLIANGGTNGGKGALVLLEADSTGDTSRIEVFGNGAFDISAHSVPGISVGSIQGTGNVFLGSDNLTVGSNNLSTVFSGVLHDGGENAGTGGSVTKLGNGKLTLSKPNTYTGGTTINGGTLLVRNKSGSATGSGPVQVNNGTLAGTGSISNAVTVGNGNAGGAILLGGTNSKSPGTLTINDPVTFNSLTSYTCGLKRTTSGSGQVTAVAGQVSAFGVTINSNVSFIFVDSGTGTLPVGTVFTAINNTSALPISGHFINLAQGSIFSSKGNTFKASYTGGSGNDLTLKVVQ